MAANYNKKYNNNISDDEIDLGRILIRFISILKRWYVVLVVTGGLGLLIGILLYINEKPVYESRMTISSTILNAKNSANMVKTLDLLIKEGNYNHLSEKFKIPVNQVQELRGLSVNAENESEEDTQSSNIFIIEARVSDNAILDTLQYGIIYYLENSNYVKRRTDLKIKNINALREKLKSEMQDLEALKSRVNNKFLTGAENSSTVIMDPVNMYKEAISMYQEELELQTQLEFADNIQLIEGFTIFNNPVSPKFRQIILSFLAGLALGFTIIFLLEIIDYSKKVKVSEYA